MAYDGKSEGSLSVDEHGGVVDVSGKDSKGAANLSITEHGGRVDVYGKVSNKSRATLSVNEYGNGTVSTWDKHGYRQ